MRLCTTEDPPRFLRAPWNDGESLRVETFDAADVKLYSWKVCRSSRGFTRRPCSPQLSETKGLRRRRCMLRTSLKGRMVQVRDALHAVDSSGVSLESGASGRRFVQHQASRVLARQLKVVPHAIDWGNRRARARSPMLCQQDGPGGSSAATWLVRRGAGGSKLKLESVKQPGHFLCWRDSEEVRNTSLVASASAGSPIFTMGVQAGLCSREAMSAESAAEPGAASADFLVVAATFNASVRLLRGPAPVCPCCLRWLCRDVYTAV